MNAGLEVPVSYRRAAGVTGLVNQRSRRPGRLGPVSLLLVGGIALVVAGCATKKDLAQVRQEMQQLQVRQDDGTRQLERKVDQVGETVVALLDSMRVQSESLMRVRGDIHYQLLQLEQQLVNVQELTGQSQQRIGELRQELERRMEQIGTGVLPGVDTAAEHLDVDDDVSEMYRLAMNHLEQGAPRTARMPLEQILEDHLDHPLAPDAQFQLAETYVLEEEYERALREFEQVVKSFPDSRRAPQALFRAGRISEERGNIDAARVFYERVKAGYPRSDEAKAAQEALERLPRRRR